MEYSTVCNGCVLMIDYVGDECVWMSVRIASFTFAVTIVRVNEWLMGQTRSCVVCGCVLLHMSHGLTDVMTVCG